MSEDKSLAHLEETLRFKKKYLRKVDETDKHLHAYTLNMKDEDLEYEWRLIEINSRKTHSIIGSFLLTLRDVLWTFLLSTVDLNAKIIKLSIEVIVFICLYQVFFSAKVKKHKKVMEILAQQDIHEQEQNKWEIIKFKLEQQKESQRQFWWYQIWWFFWVLHMLGNDFEYKFQTEVKDLPLEESITQSNVNHFMVGINFSVVIIALCLLDVHWIAMGCELTLFSIVQAQQVFVRFPRIFVDYIIVVFVIQICVFLFSYKRIKVQKSSFLKSKKIEQLLKEQREIFQNLPDGAIIHRRMVNQKSDENKDRDIQIIPDDNISVDIRHLNITFQNMFTVYKEKLHQERLEKKKQRDYASLDREDIEDSVQNNDEESQMKEEETEQNDHTFLRSVYLQKSPYKIDGKNVEQIEDQIFEPMKFIDAIKEFQSGQVYSVLTKDRYGNFNVLNQDADQTFAEKVANALNIKQARNEDKGFLVYIVTQEVLFNEEISTITYFKDITFGVLYEQVKAQQSLETAISGALQQKIRTPLQNIIETCKNLEESENLKKFESTNGQNFREQIKRTRMLSDLMVCQIKDMQDWDEMKNNKFRTVSEKFGLPECLQEIHQMMNMKAMVKGLKLEVRLGNQYIPHEVIGDQSRFMRVAINLITNALNNTQQGKVTISLAYDIEKQQVIFKVQDTGTGIKPEDQEDLFKTFKRSGGIGMGLIISREIVGRYHGRIHFESEYMVGSTFSFNFDLEEFVSQDVSFKNFKNPSIEFLKTTTIQETIQKQNVPRQVSSVTFDNALNIDSLMNIQPAKREETPPDSPQETIPLDFDDYQSPQEPLPHFDQQTKKDGEGDLSDTLVEDFQET